MSAWWNYAVGLELIGWADKDLRHAHGKGHQDAAGNCSSGLLNDKRRNVWRWVDHSSIGAASKQPGNDVDSARRRREHHLGRSHRLDDRAAPAGDVLARPKERAYLRAAKVFLTQEHERLIAIMKAAGFAAG